MKIAVLFSGGKDSVYAAWLAKKHGFKISCLVTIASKNKDSYMFHTPSIDKTIKQAMAMEIPLVLQETEGKKEAELNDLEEALIRAKEDHEFEGVVTGAIESVYQASRVQKICDKLKLKCFNPLWQKDQGVYLKELIKNKFKVMVTAVAAYPLDDSYLGISINEKFISDMKKLKEKYGIHLAGEGGEFETFVLNCPLFKKPLKVIDKQISGEGNAWRMEVDVE